MKDESYESSYAGSKTSLLKSVLQATVERERYVTSVFCFQAVSSDCSRLTGKRHFSAHSWCACRATPTPRARIGVCLGYKKS